MADIRIVPANSILSFTSSLNYIEKISQDPSGSLIIYGSGSVNRTSIFAIDGNNGRLLEVTDDLSDSIFSANTIAGLPVIEAFSDYSVKLGVYSSNGSTVNITSASYVGIGAALPAYKLHVSSSDITVTTISHNYNNASVTSSYGLLIENNNLGNDIFSTIGLGTNGTDGQLYRASIRAGRDTNEDVKAGFLSFWTREQSTGADKERMRIFGSSNASISVGSIYPRSVGTNYAGINIEGSSGGGIVFGPSSKAHYLSGDGTNTTISSGGDLIIRIGAFGRPEVARFTSDSKLGINNTSPYYTLDVNAGSLEYILNLESTWNTSAVAYGINLNVTNTASDPSSYLLRLAISNNDYFSVKTDGRVYMVLPTSSTGLGSGDLWNDGGTVKIV